MMGLHAYTNLVVSVLCNLDFCAFGGFGSLVEGPVIPVVASSECMF